MNPPKEKKASLERWNSFYFMNLYALLHDSVFRVRLDEFDTSENPLRFCKCMSRYEIWYALICILRCFPWCLPKFLDLKQNSKRIFPLHLTPLPRKRHLKKKRNPTWPEFHLTIPLDKVRMQRWIDVVLRYRTILIARWFLIQSLSAFFFGNEQIRGLTRRTWRHTI